MGTDIYANLVAAHHLYPADKKKIIFDFGTALTASCLSESGETLGVIIAPGIITAFTHSRHGAAPGNRIDKAEICSWFRHGFVHAKRNGLRLFGNGGRFCGSD